MRRTNKLLKALKGWGFNIKALRESKGEWRRFSSPQDVVLPRANIANVHPSKQTPTYQWDHYSALPGVESYMER